MLHTAVLHTTLFFCLAAGTLHSAAGQLNPCKFKSSTNNRDCFPGVKHSYGQLAQKDEEANVITINISVRTEASRYTSPEIIYSREP